MNTKKHKPRIGEVWLYKYENTDFIRQTQKIQLISENEIAWIENGNIEKTSIKSITEIVAAEDGTAITDTDNYEYVFPNDNIPNEYELEEYSFKSATDGKWIPLPYLGYTFKMKTRRRIKEK
jgi:hypothetical protein